MLTGASDAPQPHYYWDEWNGFLAPHTPRANAAESFAVALIGSGSAPPSGCEIRLRGGSFEHETLIAGTGSRIPITNSDGFEYQLFEQGGLFTATPTSPGHARRLDAVAAEGHFLIRDRLYPHVLGHLHVVANLVACADLAPNGSYRFSDVPPGEYTVQVFFRGRRVAEQSVRIGDDREVTLDAIEVPAPGDES